MICAITTFYLLTYLAYIHELAGSPEICQLNLTVKRNFYLTYRSMKHRRSHYQIQIYIYYEKEK